MREVIFVFGFQLTRRLRLGWDDDWEELEMLQKLVSPVVGMLIDTILPQFSKKSRPKIVVN